jgi:Acetoacetate decarboxylase (ADC)
MRLQSIRALRVAAAHFLDLMDTIVSFFRAIFGRSKNPYLRKWEASAGPILRPLFPPLQEPGTPRYRYSKFDFNCRLRTAVVLHFVDRETVRKLLPDLLELGEVPDAPPGTHPIMFSFGFHFKFGAIITPWPWRTVSYLEFLSSIPHTRLKQVSGGYTGPFLFPPRLWVNRLLPLLVGWALAYPKRLATIEHGAEMFSFRAAFGRPIASLAVIPSGMPGPVNQIPGTQPWCQRVNQPIMTETGKREALFSHYQFEWERAFGQPAEIRLTVESDDFPGLPKGTYTFPPLAEGAGGALLIAAPCHLQIPFPRRFLEEMNPQVSSSTHRSHF